MKYYDTNTMGFYENKIDGAIEITDEYWQGLLEKQSQGGVIQVSEGQVFCVLPSESIQNCQLINISDTQGYKDKITQEQNTAKKIELQIQIDEIDKKRIRAIAEPQLKDGANGQTWLEFYTLQVQKIREQISNL